MAGLLNQQQDQRQQDSAVIFLGALVTTTVFLMTWIVKLFKMMAIGTDNAFKTRLTMLALVWLTVLSFISILYYVKRDRNLTVVPSFLVTTDFPSRKNIFVSTLKSEALILPLPGGNDAKELDYVL